MFAVPGWSVTSSVATQTQTVKNESRSRDNPSITPSANGVDKSLKRKRGREPEKVDEAHVETVWGRVIEGRDVDRSKKSKKSKDAFKTTNAVDRSQHKKSKKGHPQRNAAQELVKAQQGPALETSSRQKSTSQPSPAPAVASAEKLTPLQASMRAKLSSARFRHLNEQLYTTPSATSLSLFTNTPILFEEYHAGFRQQVAMWPENPVDGYIAEIRARARHHKHDKKQDKKLPSGPPPLPRSSGTTTVADLGCGDAMLAQTLNPEAQTLRLKIHSFDLHSPHPLVTRADISSLPLPDGAIDVAIFCLALMGTNWLDFIDESYRIMRWGGELWVAEIKSRFSRVDSSKKVGNKIGDFKTTKDEREQEEDAFLATAVDGAPIGEKTDVNAFVAALKRRGFVLANDEHNGIDMSNKMFVKMRFIKGAKPVRGKNVGAATEDVKEDNRPKFKKEKKKKGKFLEDIDNGATIEEEEGILKPCVYKLR